MCFVFSIDVAKLIANILFTEKYKNNEIMNQSYNICCDEQITNEELISLIVMKVII